MVLSGHGYYIMAFSSAQRAEKQPFHLVFWEKPRKNCLKAQKNRKKSLRF